MSTDPRPSDALSSDLSPEVEHLLRGLGPVAPPSGLKARVLSAYARGARPSPLGRRRGLILRLAPIAAAAALLAGVGFAALGRRGGTPSNGSRNAGALSAWRVVDDPTLGLGAGRERLTSDSALAGLLEGP